MRGTFPVGGRRKRNRRSHHRQKPRTGRWLGECAPGKRWAP